MKEFLEERIKLVNQLIKHDDVTYADLALILTAVISACAAVRWPGKGIDQKRFVELLVRFSPPEQNVAHISIPNLVNAGLITEEQTPWGVPGEDTRILSGADIDLDTNAVKSKFSDVPPEEIRKYSYACLIYERLRCSYSHEYCSGESITTVPIKRERPPVSYIGRMDRTAGERLKRITHISLDYLIELATFQVAILGGESERPKCWWLDELNKPKPREQKPKKK